eukprot:TRINITY_DN4496_c0_g2_i2.p1 TRINITY_DN4496_c0_g2~~TRINITY_DN4496_c0_g2_i2.p1  ORF type:complete len:569 (-),score=144.52 TRINITY_DN4496_c0_g2_i2:67-1773(-)
MFGKQHFVEGLREQARSISRECESRLLYFRNCTDCKFEVLGSPIKIVIDNCTNVHVLLNCRHVLTGTLEAVRCKQLVLGLHQNTSIVPTLTLDLCSDVQLVLKSPSAIRNVISASDCSNIKVIVASPSIATNDETASQEVVYPIVPPADIRSQQLRSKATMITDGSTTTEEEETEATQTPVQFISRFASPTSLVTEVVVREGCGYPTTLREKTIADERERQLSERLQQIVSDSISSSLHGRQIEASPSSSTSSSTEATDTNTNNNSDADKRSLLSQINQLDISKLGLKPTTTVVRHNTAVVAGQSQIGRSFESEEELREYNDPEDEFKEKVKQVAELLKQSKHTVVFTGAGISTAASIPDYRGPNGVWTLRDKGLAPNAAVDLDVVKPTFAHYSIAKLYERRKKKQDVGIDFVVSTNIDGLHRRSGLPKDAIAEVHGNSYLEVCEKCHKEYHRDFDCTKAGCNAQHLTGRTCDREGCGGRLLDSIVHFGEGIRDFELAYQNATQSTLSLVLGTSMKVLPAAAWPSLARKNSGGKMVIVNKQKTDHDREAAVRIFANTEDFFQELMQHL